MMKRQLCAEGPTFSRIVAGVMKWGNWGANLSATEVLRLIEQCIDHGVTTFDHADIYGHYTTEALFGEALKGRAELRQKMQLVTKCGIKLVTPNRPSFNIHSYDTSKTYILAAVEQSLKNLATDHVDLLLVHRPSPLMHPDEIASAFTALKAQGKVLHFGVSNFTPTQFELLQREIPLVTNQVQASLVHLDPFLDGTFDQCLKHRITPMAYSTLGAGEFFAENPSERVLRIKKVAGALQDKYAASLDQILIAWLLQHPTGVLPVLGTSKFSRITAATAALQIKLSREEWFMLWEASTGEEVP